MFKKALIKFFTPPWSTLKRLGGQPVMQLTVLMPVFGYLIIITDQSTFLETAWLNFTSSSTIDVSWIPFLGHALQLCEPFRLYFIYFGLLFLGVGSILYASFCPAEIRNYQSRLAYIRNNLEHTTPHRRLELVEYATRQESMHKIFLDINRRNLIKRALRRYILNYLSSVNIYHDNYQTAAKEFQDNFEQLLENTPLAYDKSTELNTFRDLCGALHRLLNSRGPIVRSLIRILWSMGFIFLAVPSLYAMLAVITVLSNRIGGGP